MSLVTSCFTGSYVRFWGEFFPDTQLQWTPMFDGRAICYPTDAILKDYLAWRQADTHINNQVTPYDPASAFLQFTCCGQGYEHVPDPSLCHVTSIIDCGVRMEGSQ